MTQLVFLETSIWSVNSLTAYLKALLEGDDSLQDLWVQGEVSNLSRPASGHVYFTLKDNASSLRCVIWRSHAIRLPHRFSEGDAIAVHGNISLYEPQGQYQLYVDQVTLLGAGYLYQEFLNLKNRLEAEGYFEQSRKRALPDWPEVIGLVTSPTGAAIQDILKTIRRRFPLVQVILAPTLVQGEGSPEGIVEAIKKLNQLVKPDLIILARGGGSIEDLWAFNDPRVAQAIYDSKAPVITGIGHETDFTIADFVSDLRAPTPTAAAELATPNQLDLIANQGFFRERLDRSIHDQISDRHLHLYSINRRLSLRSPVNRLQSDRQRIDEIAYRLMLAVQHRMHIQSTNLSAILQRLMSAAPQSILKRGFAIVVDQSGIPVMSVTQVIPGDLLNIRVIDGKIVARTEIITPEKDTQ